MTVSSTSSRVVLLGNGVTTVWPFAFKVLVAADLTVIYTDASGVESTLSPSVYTATGFGLDAGGSVTYPLTGSPIATGTKITIYRSISPTQPSDFGNQGAMWPTSIMTAFDRVTMIAQGFLDYAARSLVQPRSDSTAIGALPTETARANMLLGFGPTGQPVAVTLTTSIVAVASWLVSNFLTAGTSAINACAALRAACLDAVSNFTAAINEAQGANIASATTTDIGAATGNYVKVTGTTTITGLGTIQAGTRRIVEFTGILTLTYNASSLILPGTTSITTAAGDVAMFVSLGSGNWKCANYQRANGAPVVLSRNTASLGGNVTINSTVAYIDGPKLTALPPGTYWIDANTLIFDGGASNVDVVLWDGTNVINSTAPTTAGANVYTPVHLAGYITLAVASDVKLSAMGVTGTTAVMVFNRSGNSKDSTISALRIA